MLLKSLEEILSGTAHDVGERWLAKVRAVGNTRALNEIGDGELLSVHEEVMRKLARWFELEADKNEIGAFFVMVGKEYCALGVPISELTFALNLDRKAVTEYLTEGEELEGAHRIYALMEAVDKVAEFYMLSAYYMTKGYLEETFVRLRKCEGLPDEALTKYFKDDFFFK
ncbi:MAG TPA: hypothetical protein VFL04_07090 [Rectinemataceae bacterium]|nr:hypothetical protein [Rectinemataceae bacterium]